MKSLLQFHLKVSLQKMIPIETVPGIRGGGMKESGGGREIQV
jgi:hypothetical protein